MNNTGDTGLDVFDAATLEPESGTQLTYEFASYSGATGGDIIGTLSEDRIKDIEDHGTSRYEIFRRQGARTGRSGGFEIDKVGGEAFRPTLDQSETDSGDSGGPYHVENVAPMAETELVAPSGVEIEWDPFSHIAGVHQGNDPDVSYTVATSMYRVEEEFGVSV